MESQISLNFRDLESLRLRAVALREREDREAQDYQSKREQGSPASRVEVAPLPVDVITGRALRNVSAAN